MNAQTCQFPDSIKLREIQVIDRKSEVKLKAVEFKTQQGSLSAIRLLFTNDIKTPFFDTQDSLSADFKQV